VSSASASRVAVVVPSRAVRGASAGAAEEEEEEEQRRRAPAAVAAAVAAILATSVATPEAAFSAETIAEFQASGLVFKDTVDIMAIKDPMVQGVTIFFSEFKRSVASRMQANLFSEPSQAALACVRDETDPLGVRITGNITGFQGMEVFSERKNLNLLDQKVVRVRRVFHPESNTIIYLSYSTRSTNTGNSEEGPSAGQYKTSLCTISLRPGEAPAQK